jgi:RNA polymerase primary sigma factor
MPMDFSPADETQLEEFFRTVSEAATLSPAEEKALALRIEGGDSEARERLVRANLRLVVDAARARTDSGAGLLKLVQEGTVGLLYAVEAYDPGTNARFADCAKPLIEQAIHDSLALSSRQGEGV